MIFAVFDVLLAVNMCINYSFLHLYIYIGVITPDCEPLLWWPLRLTFATADQNQKLARCLEDYILNCSSMNYSLVLNLVCNLPALNDADY